MRIISYNIRFGGQKRAPLIAHTLKSYQPDLVILVEAYKPQVVRSLAQALELPFYACHAKYSLAFLSATAPEHFQWHSLSAIRSPFLEIRLNKELTVFGLHLSSRLTRQREKQRLHEIHQLLQVTQHCVSPHMLIGDFNAIAPHDRVDFEHMPFWLRWLIRLNGGLGHDALQTVINANYIDAFRHLNPFDNGYTLPPPHPNTRLDYAFLTTSLLDSLENCSVIREPDSVNTASDHYPLLLDLAL